MKTRHIIFIVMLALGWIAVFISGVAAPLHIIKDTSFWLVLGPLIVACALTNSVIFAEAICYLHERRTE